jgi:hypothetical protein
MLLLSVFGYFQENGDLVWDIVDSRGFTRNSSMQRIHE